MNKKLVEKDVETIKLQYITLTDTDIKRTVSEAYHVIAPILKHREELLSQVRTLQKRCCQLEELHRLIGGRQWRALDWEAPMDQDIWSLDIKGPKYFTTLKKGDTVLILSPLPAEKVSITGVKGG